MSDSRREITRPSEGTFSTRFVKGGPMVPVRMTRENDRWRAVVDGKPQSYAYTDAEVEAAVMTSLLDGKLSSHPFVKLLTHAVAIKEAEYERMLALRVWARASAPWHPCLHPHEKIDTTKLPGLW